MTVHRIGHLHETVPSPTGDQFTGRPRDELAEMAEVRGLDVPHDASAEQLRDVLRRYRARCTAEGNPSGYATFRIRSHAPAPGDERERRIDEDIRALLTDGAAWTVRAIRAATMRSGEEVRASLLRIGARGDGTGRYREKASAA